MNSILRRLERICPQLLLAAAASLSGLASAPAGAQATNVDPPGRVARIAETFGQVWLYSADTGEWISAVRNRPVTSGDRVATDAGARVELSLGSTTLRLDADSELEVQRLDDAQVALYLHNGSAALRVRDPRAVGEFELSTAEGRLRVRAAGRYRFDRIDRSTNLTVYSGQAFYEGPGSALTVEPGQRGQFWLEANGAAQYSITEPVRDSFAGWNNERDRNEDRLATARYVSPEMTGAQDLDRYGRWEQSPDYGAIWFPRGVAVGWAPYSTGHWTWIRPWGWTWVDDAPWGFAPFHYGRWVYYRNSWCWAPGTFAPRPVYAPALVAWVGGPSVNVSISIGGGGPAVGWFPLAPREVYVPGYYASPRYVREVNITNVTNVTVIRDVINNPNGAPRDYANRKYPHAVTVVPTSVLTNHEPVGPSAARIRDLPPVRALVTEPARATATFMPPVVSSLPAQRGLEARPFRAPIAPAAGVPISPMRAAPAATPPQTPNAPVSRPVPPPPVNAIGEGRRGVPERAPIVRPPVNAFGEARQAPATAPPPQIGPRPVRIEPPAAPTVRPAEAPRPAEAARPPAPAAAARVPEQRPQGKPEGPPGRDDRRDPADRGPAR